MTGKSFILSLFLIAVSLRAASSQVTADCATLNAAKATIAALAAGDTFQISSFNLQYIPSMIDSACGAYGFFAEVESEDNDDEFDFDYDPALAQVTDSVVTETDVKNALMFDTIVVNNYGGSTKYKSYTKSYCTKPLRAYFMGLTFPSTSGSDTASARSAYLSGANTFYTKVAGPALGC
eukprot:CAMPEP_0176434716 /NCGR_PEP_ID=MMETSP0127-20121128/16854_1 /TAXON_ID=938130 /ORGANISM="Platyophrya macrostoma, Strain WH" /LENGTH=178 /DNA_ID=CAMNT_0017817529 /DNA_START=50 /DNA_END=586 /DNA_ORIENTATION=-